MDDLEFTIGDEQQPDEQQLEQPGDQVDDQVGRASSPGAPAGFRVPSKYNEGRFGPAPRPPADWDSGRKQTARAPWGYRTSGEKWAPFGLTPKWNKPKLNPDGPKAATGGAERAAEGRKFNAKDKYENPYARLDWLHAEEVRIVQQIREQHADTELGDPIHPKDITFRRKHDDPLSDPASTENTITLLTNVVGHKFGVPPSALPSPEKVKRTGELVADASRYYGVSLDPKSLATIKAVSAVVGCFAGIGLHVLLTKIGEWFGWNKPASSRPADGPIDATAEGRHSFNSPPPPAGPAGDTAR